MLNRSDLVRLVGEAKASATIDAIIRNNPLPYRAARRTIEAFERADLDERLHLSAGLLARTLRWAASTAYGSTFGTAAERWPILDKALVRDAPVRLLRRSWSKIPAATSGTSGTPLRLWRSLSSVAVEQAFLDWLLGGPRLSFRRSRIAVLRGDDVKALSERSPPFGVYRQHGRRLILSSPHLSRTTLDWYLRALEEHQPDVLWVYPSRLAHLINLMLHAGKKLHLPLVLSSSEMLPPELFGLVETVMGARIVDFYGQAERVCLAVSRRPHEFWFVPSYGRVELTLEPGNDATAGCWMAKIIGTGYWNSVMPLIRYDTGDCAIVPAGSTANSLAKMAVGLLPFHGIAGRPEEYLIAPGSARIGALDHIPREVDHVLQTQFVQNRRDEVVIRLIATPDFGATDEARLLSNARKKIPDSISIAVEVVDRLTVLPSGKTPDAIALA